MSSRPLIIGAIAIGIAIGYAGGFFTFYNELSDVQGVDAAAIRGELDSLKDELERANTRVSIVSEDNERLRSSLTEMRASNEVLQRRVDVLHQSVTDPSGSLAKIEKGIDLIHDISGPIPYEGAELAEWRLAVVDDTAKLDPALVPAVLKLVDSWVDIVRFEENEPPHDSPEWNRWNVEWQQKALILIHDYQTAVSILADVIIEEIESLRARI